MAAIKGFGKYTFMEKKIAFFPCKIHTVQRPYFRPGEWKEDAVTINQSIFLANAVKAHRA